MCDFDSTHQHFLDTCYLACYLVNALLPEINRIDIPELESLDFVERKFTTIRYLSRWCAIDVWPLLDHICFVQGTGILTYIINFQLTDLYRKEVDLS